MLNRACDNTCVCVCVECVCVCVCVCLCLCVFKRVRRFTSCRRVRVHVCTGKRAYVYACVQDVYEGSLHVRVHVYV